MPSRRREPDLEQLLAEGLVERLLVFTDAPSGLRAYLVIDDLTLGPAVGGTRTRAYPSAAAAVQEAAALARAMTLKCALAGLDAGGAKMVVDAHPGLDRPAAFRVLGERVEELGGIFLTAGDLGTRRADLEAMATATSRVRTDEDALAAAVADGVLGCIAACASVRGREGVRGLRVAVQGCGAIGAALARRLALAGAEVLVADVDPQAVARTVTATGAGVTSPEEILLADVDVVAPCAVGGVIDHGIAAGLRAWAVCGAANNALADPSVGATLADRDVLHVPDVIASAGAVIHGVCAVRGDGRAAELVAGLGRTAREVLEAARSTGRTAVDIARERAEERIRAARG